MSKESIIIILGAMILTILFCDDYIWLFFNKDYRRHKKDEIDFIYPEDSICRNCKYKSYTEWSDGSYEARCKLKIDNKERIGHCCDLKECEYFKEKHRRAKND